jgi:hypothetical protein
MTAGSVANAAEGRYNVVVVDAVPPPPPPQSGVTFEFTVIAAIMIGT